MAIPALRILGSASTGNESFTDLLIKNGVLEAFEEVIDSPKSIIRR